MVVDFKNKTITIEKGTTPSQLFNFLKTIIHEGIQEFSLDIVTSKPYSGIKTPMVSDVEIKKIKDIIEDHRNIKTPYVAEPWKVTFHTDNQKTVATEYGIATCGGNRLGVDNDGNVYTTTLLTKKNINS